MKFFISKHLLHLRIRVIVKGKWKTGVATTLFTVIVQNLANVGIAVTWSGSPKPSASLTNWIKLHWWKTSCMPPLRHHATLSLAGISGWLSPRRASHVADVKPAEAEQRWVRRVGERAGFRHAERRSICCLQMTHIWQLSPNSCQEEMSCGSNHWRFSFWDSLTAFLNFFLSPRFQDQLQTQKCVSPLSAERGFMCSADYYMSLLSAESKL